MDRPRAYFETKSRHPIVAAGRNLIAALARVRAFYHASEVPPRSVYRSLELAEMRFVDLVDGKHTEWNVDGLWLRLETAPGSGKKHVVIRQSPQPRPEANANETEQPRA